MAMIPVWPLPCDWKWAGGDTNPMNSTFCVQCSRCTQWLSLDPNDTAAAVKRHKTGLKCRKGREVVAMNREGYHVMSMNGAGFWAECLRPVMREGKFFKFYPAPIVSFIRWKLPNGGTSSNGATKEFHRELLEFMKLTEEEQIAQLSGAILQYEFEKEARGGSSSGNMFRTWGRR